MNLFKSSITAALLVGATIASAQITTFTTRASWLSQVTVSLSDDFEGHGWTSEVNVNGATLNGITYNSANHLVGEKTLTFDAPYLTSCYVEWQSPGLLRLSLNGSYTAIAFDFGQFYGAVTPFTISFGGAAAQTPARAFMAPPVSDGYTQTLTTADNAYSFVGFISATPFSTLTLSSDPFPILDNIAVGNAGSSTAVPEPSTYGLFGAVALLGLAVWRRQAARR